MQRISQHLSRYVARWALTVALALSPVACDDRDLVVDDDPPDLCDDAVLEISLPNLRALDVLFVLDNSATMGGEIEALQSHFEDFMNALDTGTRGRLDLHIGVITTDVGTGPNNGGTGCTANGDNGSLQARGPGPNCQNPAANAFIIDTSGPDGSRIVNYPGTLGEAFACLADVGTDGCGFEQPLESIARALDSSNPRNSGFSRFDASLLLVILSDEDDCSAVDTGMFDTSQNGPEEPLGSLSSFRCFDFGVRCEPDAPREPGDKSSCEPRADSLYMLDVAEHAASLRAAVGDDEVIVAAIVGDVAPVSVIEVDTAEGGVRPALAPSCQSVRGDADPPVRLAAFTETFGNNGKLARICEDDLASPLIEVANHAADAASIRCLDVAPDVALRDVDGDPSNGVQPECAVREIDWDDETPWPVCDHPSDPQNLPCYIIEPHERCDTASGLSVRVLVDQDAPPARRELLARCALVDTPLVCPIGE